MGGGVSQDPGMCAYLFSIFFPGPQPPLPCPVDGRLRGLGAVPPILQLVCVLFTNPMTPMLPRALLNPSGVGFVVFYIVLLF